MGDSELKTFTSLSVSTNTTHPSIHCIQWSAEGQALLATKSTIYILTPDAGVNFELSTVIKSTPEKDENGCANILGWFRTMVEFEKGIVHQWPLDSQDWAAVSLGSLDVLLRSVTCSPINVDGAGCVIAALNSNLEVTLWGAAKNHLRGEWKKLCDITAILKALHGEKIQPTLRSLQEQTLCIAWSQQAQFNINPAPNLDGSLLAIGSRGGTISFFQYHSKDVHGATAVHVHTVNVADEWITHIAWSPWSGNSSGRCEAYLAYALNNGFVAILKVMQTLCVAPSEANFGTEYTVKRDFEIQDFHALAADRRVTSALHWVDIPGGSLVLVCTKPGVVDISPWPTPTADSGTETRRLFLQRQDQSVDSSSMYPVSGFTYVEQQDVLVISLFDGSFHAIHRLSSSPTLTPADDNTSLSAELLSRRSYRVFRDSETDAVKRISVGRISGMMPYDGLSTIAWIHEACHPSDFSYKHDARHNSMFIVTQLWADRETDQNRKVIRQIEAVFSSVNAASGYAPLYKLRPIFFWLGQNDIAIRNADALLRSLQTTSTDESAIIDLPSFPGPCSPKAKQEFRNSLFSHLYGWNSFLLLRMKLAFADHCWTLAKGDPQVQSKYGETAHHLLGLIFQRIQRILIRHLKAMLTTLTTDDIPFVMRVVVQATLHGSPDDLSTEAQDLAAQVNKVVTGDPHLGYTEEVCPACHTTIPLQDFTGATCENGHVWRRCSITTFILSTPEVRTCIGCSRKAFLPISQESGTDRNHLPLGARGWVAAELLQAVQRCLFCGNSFVSIV